MMRVIFAGVGEAFDESLANTALLVTRGSGLKKQHILLDCGFTAAHAFWRAADDPLELDTVWISHFHGDHFLGIPLLLLRFWEQGRTTPLQIIGQEGVREKVFAAMELAYPAFQRRITFPIGFSEVSAGQELSRKGCRWSFARGLHSQPCLAVRLDCSAGSVFYSGDGRPTPATADLATGVDLMVHEAFGIDTVHEGHGSVRGSIEFARTTRAKHLALVHLNRDVRRIHQDQIKKDLAALDDLPACLPEPGDETEIEA